MFRYSMRSTAVVLCGVFFAAKAGLGQPPMGVAEQLDEMRDRGTNFDPSALRALGSIGMRGVLDKLVPVAPSIADSLLDPQQVADLIARLDHEKFAEREEAMHKLASQARAHANLVETAHQTGTAEVRVRTAVILAGWRGPGPDEVMRYSDAFSKYVEGIRDRDSVKLMAERVRKVAEAGRMNDGQLKIVELMIANIAQAVDDDACETLRPLVQHRDDRIALLVTKTVGSHRQSRKFPLLLVDALGSDRDAVTDTAISWTSNCWDERRREDVHAALRAIFERRAEPLKFHACFPLMHDYNDAEAFSYLLEQTQSQDLERARYAISWVGDSCNTSKPVTREILARLLPLFKSPDHDLRRRAADALGTYSGEDVIKNLIPMLGDPQRIIVEETARRLADKRDRATTRHLLEKTLASQPDAPFRWRAEEILDKLDFK